MYNAFIDILIGFYRVNTTNVSIKVLHDCEKMI